MALSKLIRYNQEGYSDRNIAMRQTADRCGCGSCLCCRIGRFLRRLDRMKVRSKLASR